jgi:hypothetical protein
MGQARGIASDGMRHHYAFGFFIFGFWVGFFDGLNIKSVEVLRTGKEPAKSPNTLKALKTKDKTLQWL